MRTQQRENDGKQGKVKICPPSRRRAYARVDKVIHVRSDKAVRWIAKDSGQTCR